MDVLRRLLIAWLCLGIALTGRGPVTELTSSWGAHDHAGATARHASHEGRVLAASGEAHRAVGTHRHGDAATHVHSLAGGHLDGPAGGAEAPADDSCACGCGMGSCAALPADLLLHHPELPRIALRIELPAPRTAVHSPSPMALLLRPPIG